MRRPDEAANNDVVHTQTRIPARRPAKVNPVLGLSTMPHVLGLLVHAREEREDLDAWCYARGHGRAREWGEA